MPESNSLQPGRKFGNGRFVLVRALGRGGMGEVWLAEDERLHESVALKFLPAEIRGDPTALDDLRRETVRSHKLTHPNIVRIHDLHEDPDGTAFIIMEYVDGPTLAALRLQPPNRVLPWDFLRPLLEQLCTALDYAHGEKVIHRDLKPANMMVDSRGRLKLADFGIAAVASDSMSRVSQEYLTSGTLLYMSPQQLAGKRAQVTDDIYALGATLYELLTSKPPFHIGDITHQVLSEAPEPMEDRLTALEIENAVPPDVIAMVMACLAKEPAQRPRSARAVAGWIRMEDARPSPVETLRASVCSSPEGESLANPLVEPSPTEAPLKQRRSKSASTKKLTVFVLFLIALALALTQFGVIPNRVGGRRDGRGVNQVLTPDKSSVSSPPPAALSSQPSLPPSETVSSATSASKVDMTNPPSSPPASQPQPSNISKAHPMAVLGLNQHWTNSLGMRFVPVAGTTVLFCIWDTRVKDFQAFVNDTGYEIKKGLWEMTSNGPQYFGGGDWRNPGWEQAPTSPVCAASWEDAHAFCGWLTRKDRYGGRLSAGWAYRLPTDGEWSKAVGLQEEVARPLVQMDSDLKRVYTWGSQWPPPTGAGNFAGEEATGTTTWGTISGYRDGFARTSPVGSFQANQFGLYDMSGNLWQWCEDLYEPSHPERVLRGGSWLDTWNFFLSSRRKQLPHDRIQEIGFRCVLAKGGIRALISRAQPKHIGGTKLHKFQCFDSLDNFLTASGHWPMRPDWSSEILPFFKEFLNHCQQFILDTEAIDTCFDPCLCGFRLLKKDRFMGCGFLDFCARIDLQNKNYEF